MTGKEWAEIILSGVLVLANIALIKFYRENLKLIKKNLKLIKELSSPKPFLKPVSLKFDGAKPIISIKNYGAGHAVNVKVKVLLDMWDSINGDIDKDVWIEYSGESVIPYIEGQDNVVEFRYKGDKNVVIGENTKICIEYESDSGAKGEIVWEYVADSIDERGYRYIAGR